MFIQAQKNAPVYVMKQTNTFFWMFFAILGTFRHGPPENSCIFFHFPSILRCLPNCRQLTFHFNCQYWCPAPSLWWMTCH